MMSKTPLDEIISKIAQSSQLTEDEIYVFFLLDRYGDLNIDNILKKSKSRSWQKPIPKTLGVLVQLGLVEEEDGNYQSNSLEEFYEKVKSNIDLSIDQLKALLDFI